VWFAAGSDRRYDGLAVADGVVDGVGVAHVGLGHRQSAWTGPACACLSELAVEDRDVPARRTQTGTIAFKTLITHATSQAARFLGYEIRTQRADTKITRSRRAVNGAIGLFVPRDVIKQRCARYMSGGKPALRGLLLHDNDFTIVAKYQAEYRGLVQYYLLAQDVFRLSTLRWVMETSMLKTLAGKHKSTVTKMAAKYKAVIDTPDGPRTCFQVIVHRDRGRKPLVARFGAIALKRKRTAALADLSPTMASTKRNELIHRLLAECCEICQSRTNIEVHHVRKLADLNRPGRPDRPAWVHLMAKRRRKTLVICRAFHEDIHAGRANAPTRN
jgi:hypothetical protein